MPSFMDPSNCTRFFKKYVSATAGFSDAHGSACFPKLSTETTR